MREISLHILDIVQNSIVAGASRIEVVATADTVADQLTVAVKDNGRGMSPDMVEQIRSPFCTTRTTRNVGLGIPMLSAAAEMCEGAVSIVSNQGSGTKICATFRLSHIDRMPYGNITETMISLIVANPEIDIRYEQTVNGNTFCLNTADVRRELGEVPIQTPPVISWLRDYLGEGIAAVGIIP